MTLIIPRDAVARVMVVFLISGCALLVITGNRTRPDKSKSLLSRSLTDDSLHERNTKRLWQLRDAASSCQCRSLFTIGACGLEEVEMMKPKDHIWRSALRSMAGIRKVPKGQSYVDALKTLSRYRRQNFMVEMSANKTSRAAEITHPDGQLPFTRCSEHKYSPSDIRSCLENIKNKTGESLKIVFMGDSRARYLMKYFFKSIELSIDKDFINGKKLRELYSIRIRNDWNISFANVQSSLVWAPYLDEFQLASETLRSWCSDSAMLKDLPDILLVSYGTWPANFKGNLLAFADSFHAVQLFKDCFTKISEKSIVLWLMPEPVKTKHSVIGGTKNAQLDFMHDIVWYFFRNSNVIIWDTREVLAIMEIIECSELGSAGYRFNSPEDWNCWDEHHMGSWANLRSAKMILNFICGNIRGENDDQYCCN